jgi:hypothetical protein
MAHNLLGSDAAKKHVQDLHTEKVAFAPGGVVRVPHSFGNLNIEGWDRDEVEVTVHRCHSRDYEPAQVEHAVRALERVHVTTERGPEKELVVSTVLPRKRFWHFWGGKDDVKLEYLIHVPQSSSLIVHHGPGNVLIGNVSGNVEATSVSGDIMLMLSDSRTYSIDAKSKLGTVASDLDGEAHRRHISGSAFVSEAASPSSRIYLRTLMGGIWIKLLPPEGREVASVH